MSTTTFGFETTAAEAASGIDLTGKRVIVTGAASGIGVETARALAGTGAEVTLAVRDFDAGAQTADDIDGDVHVAHLDLADQASVKAFAAAWDGPLHVLVNNAGVMAIQELTRTPEGWEMQFATNHLGHFALALGLHDALAADGAARIVSVSSSAHLRSDVQLDDLHFEHRPYEPWAAYGQSKTANILFAVEFDRRHKERGVRATAVHPGGIQTELGRHMGPGELEALVERMNAAQRAAGAPAFEFKSIPQGAATSVWAGVVASADDVGGRYCEDCHFAELVEEEGMREGVRAYALDPDRARALWAKSEEMVGEHFE